MFRLDILVPGHVLAYIEDRFSLMEKIQAEQFDSDKLRVNYGKVLVSEVKTTSLNFEGV